MDKKTSVEVDFAGKKLTLETGQLAPQATTSILARLGDTMVLATVVAGNLREDLGYFPLTVEYVERLYAGGRIKGSRWVKREGRPSDEAVLIGRLIDRSIRPLFPKEYKNEVQVVVTVLSVDGENEPDILALNAVSAALAISPIPWNGPIGAIRMGHVKESEEGGTKFLPNPTRSEAANSEIEIIVSQTKDKTHMIEAGAAQAPEAVMVEAIKLAQDETKKIISLVENLVKKVGQKKVAVKPNTQLSEMAARIEKTYKEELSALAKDLAQKEAGGRTTSELVDTIFDQEKLADPTADLDKKIIAQALEYVMYKQIKSNAVNKKQRPDGRKIDELRPISIQIGVLPRTHGSAIFERGLTQALTVATLGSPRLEQLIESAEGEESKRYIHHYSMPPYSVGEAGRFFSASRREIGHGALAERALEPVIPTKDKFPYTIRIVSEILSSNGSTSMASVCGSTLALMDAGVPILSPVSGISVGMMSLPASGQASGDKYVLLTDIIGLEDFSGDMDFKVAGTALGVTAIQLDVKIPGLTLAQIQETFDRARDARMVILEKMLAVIPQYRAEVSEHAPKIEMIQIPVEKIGEVIGPGGRVIKQIIADTGAEVDVEDDGAVTVSGTDDEAVQKAADWVRGIVREVTPGEEFEGQVKRILPFGAFVEFLPGKEGMVHVSQMAKGFVKSPDEVVALGDTVKVRVVEIDDQGRVNLSMLFGADAEEKARGGGDRGSSGGGFDANRGDRGPRRDFRSDRHGGDFRSGGYRGGGGTISSGTGRPVFRGNDRDDRGTERKHPLAQQFERERQAQRPQTGRKRYGR